MIKQLHSPIILLSVSLSCKSIDTVDSQIKADFPPDSILSFDISPTISCDTASMNATIDVIKPSNGQAVTLNYKSSDQINYFADGWENRIPAMWDFFNDE